MKVITITFFIISGIIIAVFLGFSNYELELLQLFESVKTNRLSYSLFSFLFLTSDIILPIPSSIVMYLNGMILGLSLGTFLSLTSSILSSIIGYYLGVNFKFIEKRFHTQKEIEDADNLFNTCGDILIIISRGIPVLSETISVVSGTRLVGLKKFTLYNFLGYLPICIIYSLAGFFGRGKEQFLLSFMLVLLISCAFWLIGRKVSANSKTG